jgi:hypothetical protein
MADSWLHVGAPILITAGQWKGFDATVQAVDAASDTVVVSMNIFGRPISLTFGLSSADQHLAPYGDQPPVPRCPDEDLRKQELLAACPGAEAVYQSYFMRSVHQTYTQISRSGSNHRLLVRTHNMTWPASEKMRWATRAVPLAESAWDHFSQLVEACDFWRLPYDDGRRVLPDKRSHYRLEGCEQGRYHKVVREADQGRADIADCCEYLWSLADASGVHSAPAD